METAELSSIAESVKTFTEATKGTLAEQSARLFAIEQKMTAPNGGLGRYGDGGESIGALVANSDGYKALARGARSTGAISVGNFHKTAIVNATGQNQPLVQDYRVPGIIAPGQRRLTIRDLLPSFPCPSNLVQFVRESATTNAAAPQTGGSPNSGENVAKAESAMTFTLANAAVQTLAHWIPASRQILDDAVSLQLYLNQRLLYLLKLEEEIELLNGDGSGNNLSGLIANATAYDTSLTTVASDTFIDVLAHAIAQVQDGSDFEATGIVVNNLDWSSISLIKTTGTASSGEYVYSDPHSATGPRLWGLPVVPTKSLARGQFLVGAFNLAAAIWDRNDATVEISREHSDFFIKNMCALLAEERLCLTVFRPLALVTGGFPFGS
jgi:HK97 family phage major capsid protein